jgi:hypothetical protein
MGAIKVCQMIRLTNKGDFEPPKGAASMLARWSVLKLELESQVDNLPKVLWGNLTGSKARGLSIF